METTVLELINTVFKSAPLDVCAYKIESPLIHNDNDNHDIIMFPILMNIMISGAKILYGQDTTPQSLSVSQFNKLKQYIMSLGYQVEHSYTNIDQLQMINIWFKKINVLYDCKGNKIFI
jgi:hypothetical protein